MSSEILYDDTLLQQSYMDEALSPHQWHLNVLQNSTNKDESPGDQTVVIYSANRETDVCVKIQPENPLTLVAPITCQILTCLILFSIWYDSLKLASKVQTALLDGMTRSHPVLPYKYQARLQQ